MDNTIIIVTELSNDTINLSCVSLKSILENNKDNSIEFIFLYDGLLDIVNINLIKNIIKKYKNIINFNFIKIKREKYKILINKTNFGFRNRLYLFELPYLTNYEKVLYISPYTIVCQNIKQLFNMNIENNSCAGVENLEQGKIQDLFNLKSKIFSNDILLINLNKWRKQDYFQRLFSSNNIENHSAYRRLPTWIYFNIIINDCKFINFKFNYIISHFNTVSCSLETNVMYKKLCLHIENPITFTIYTPYNNISDKYNSYASLWWKYAEQTPIYDKIKEYKNSNKYKLSTTSAQNSFKYGWLLSRIFPYIKPYWFRILIGFLIAIPLGLLDGVTAFALKPYMDFVIGGKDFIYNAHGFNLSINSLQMAFIIPIGVILFAVLQGVLRYLNGYCSTWTSQRITNDVKFDLFDRLIHMHPQFFDDNSSGIVISRYMGDPGTASAGIVDNVKTITTSLCGALGLIAVMLYSSWKLAFIGILVLCIAFVPVALIRKRIKEASNKNMVIGSNITTNINETYSGNKVMAAYDLQDRQNEYFKEQTWKSFNINMSLYKRAGWMSPLMYTIASCGIATVLGVGTYLINSGQMTAGSFASFVTSLLLLYKPVKTLGNTMTGIQNIFVAMGRVFELFDLEPAIKDCENPKTLQGLNNNISFEDVTFEYVPNNPVLNNLTLTVPKNETLAIVGNSGGGKSTLVNLIPRFYDIKSGSIKIDGVDIREYSLKSLRKNISMVFQDNFLYSGTIKENIMMGNPNATVEELMEAIKSAHLQDMIQELPDGLDTMLGERGLTLSGGQRQRVAIARAMLRNAPIVILDEATSALDNESEAIVQKAMDNLMKNRTVFIIAHRLSTIKNADRIAVINQGHLVELGTHDELMQIENGQYKALYEMQFKHKQEAGV